MKVICDRSALLEAINLVSGAVASRTPRPQLQCVKLEATKKGSAGELTLLATDGELSLRLKLSAVDVQQVGECLIPADKLRQIVGAE
ncbi:MAG: DNA polymerase III subunit beta, partial [Planctomycetota bacterium]